jgi:hypothetical protein
VVYPNPIVAIPVATHGNTLSKVAFLRAIPEGDENEKPANSPTEQCRTITSKFSYTQMIQSDPDLGCVTRYYTTGSDVWKGTMR